METQLPLIPTFLILVVVMVLRYFLLSGLFYWLVQRLPLPPISSRGRTALQNRTDIKWSLYSSLIFAITGTLLIALWKAGYSRIYIKIGDYGYGYFFLSLPIYLVLHDTYYYWMHRLLHRSAFYSQIHWVHHASIVPTAWTSFAFHPLEAIGQAIFIPLMVMLIPIHWTLLFLFLTIMTLFGITNHLGYEVFPAFVENRLKLITATHHQQHHERPRTNFGLYFTWWDALMKTEGRARE